LTDNDFEITITMSFNIVIAEVKKITIHDDSENSFMYKLFTVEK